MSRFHPRYYYNERSSPEGLCGLPKAAFDLLLGLCVKDSSENGVNPRPYDVSIYGDSQRDFDARMKFNREKIACVNLIRKNYKVHSNGTVSLKFGSFNSGITYSNVENVLTSASLGWTGTYDTEHYIGVYLSHTKSGKLKKNSKEDLKLDGVAIQAYLLLDRLRIQTREYIDISKEPYWKKTKLCYPLFLLSEKELADRLKEARTKAENRTYFRRQYERYKGHEQNH